MMNNIMTIDVEDHYHVLDVEGTPSISEWDSIPSTVEKNFIKMMNLMQAYDVKTTCFFLGYIAKRFPHLVRLAKERGHDISSHGMYHQMVRTQSKREFIQDIKESKKCLEDICGEEILGYRAPGFSVINENPYFFEELINAGYQYDSSIFPAKHGHGGFNTDILFPSFIETSVGRIFEFPISVSNVLNKRICFFGGGYLRFFHHMIIRHETKKVNNQGRPVVFYIHPREIDPSHPRIKMNFFRHFKSYVNLQSTEGKLRNILSNNQFETMRDYYLKRK